MTTFKRRKYECSQWKVIFDVLWVTLIIFGIEVHKYSLWSLAINAVAELQCKPKRVVACNDSTLTTKIIPIDIIYVSCHYIIYWRDIGSAIWFQICNDI